jgi:ferritin-like metal-binding protein YciE
MRLHVAFKRQPPIEYPTQEVTMETLSELFEETLKDVYYAEKAILKALPKMAKKVGSEELRSAFLEHVDQTEGQVERLDQVFKLLGKKPQGKECPAINGLIEETEEVMKEAKDKHVLDAAVIGCAQAVEHYEIARYGTLRTWAELLGHREAVSLLQETLDEEELTDRKLSDIAEELNAEAVSAEDDEASEDDDAPVKSKRSATGGARKPA